MLQSGKTRNLSGPKIVAGFTEAVVVGPSAEAVLRAAPKKC